MMQFFQQYLVYYYSALVLWSFLMVGLYNLVKKSAKPNSDATLVKVSFLIFISYFISDPLFTELIGFQGLEGEYAYLILALVEAITVITILYVSRARLVGDCPAKFYVVLGLSTNMVLFLGMYIDLYIVGSYEYWWFWYFYSTTVNLMDLMMIVALFTNKDFLGLVNVYRKVFTNLKPKT